MQFKVGRAHSSKRSARARDAGEGYVPVDNSDIEPTWRGSMWLGGALTAVSAGGIAVATLLGGPTMVLAGAVLAAIPGVFGVASFFKGFRERRQVREFLTYAPDHAEAERRILTLLLGREVEMSPKALTELLSHPDRKVRSHAAAALGHIGDAGAVAPLRRLADAAGRDLELRAGAESAVDRIKSRLTGEGGELALSPLEEERQRGALEAVPDDVGLSGRGSLSE